MLPVVGRMRAEGGELSIGNCTMSGALLAGSSPALAALQVHGGHVALNASQVVDHTSGAISILHGKLDVLDSALLRNGGGNEALFGAIRIDDGEVDMANTRVEGNGRTEAVCTVKSKCMRGGALRLGFGLSRYQVGRCLVRVPSHRPTSIPTRMLCARYSCDYRPRLCSLSMH